MLRSRRLTSQLENCVMLSCHYGPKYLGNVFSTLMTQYYRFLRWFVQPSARKVYLIKCCVCVCHACHIQCPGFYTITYWCQLQEHCGFFCKDTQTSISLMIWTCDCSSHVLICFIRLVFDQHACLPLGLWNMFQWTGSKSRVYFIRFIYLKTYYIEQSWVY